MIKNYDVDVIMLILVLFNHITLRSLYSVKKKVQNTCDIVYELLAYSLLIIK